MRRTHPPRTLAACAAALALALGATACDSDSPPTTATTASSSVPTTSSSTVSTSAPPTTGTDTATEALRKPTFPAAAKERTPEGAEAFVRYYVDALNYAWTKPDSKILDGLVTNDCEPCADHLEQANSLVAESQHYVPIPYTVQRLNHVLVEDDRERVSADILQVGSKIVDANGEAIDAISQDKLKMVFILKWNDKWLLYGLV